VSLLDKALTVSYIAASIGGLYDAYARRRKERENDAKDRRIQSLEERIAALEAAAPRLVIP
jgi:hypothetical protein